MQQYPKNILPTLESHNKALQQITRIRDADITERNTFDSIFMRGRKVGKVPTAYNDIAATDRVGDFNYDSTYLYLLISGTAWATIPFTSFDQNLAFYGEMYGTNIAQTVVIAVADTFVQIGAGITGGLTNGFTFQNAKELKCTKAGKYLINWSISAQTASVANKECEGAVMIGGVAQTKATAHAEVSPGGSGRPETLSATGIFQLALNDLVSLAVSNHTDTTDFVVEHVSLTALRLGA